MLMLLVTFQTAAGPAILRHAAWHGLTLADIVFPIFLLIVGISTSLALDGRRRPMAWVAVVRRGAMLFAIGVALNWCLRPELDWGQLRWTGVLQRIAIVYRSEEHTSELQSLMRISYAVFFLKKKNYTT